jgi:hypothetical protein
VIDGREFKRKPSFSVSRERELEQSDEVTELRGV